MSKLIQLNNSTKLVTVDDEDFDRLQSFQWCLVGGNKGGVSRGEYVSATMGKPSRVKRTAIANQIMDRFDCIFDHTDRDSLNCTKSNLRESTHQQNCFNRAKQINSTSQFKGVSFDKAAKKWRASITCNNRKHSLGMYTNQLDAAKAYNKAAINLFKAFAFLNRNEQGEVL